jgi:predicted N-acetyltransferase YhbS
MEENTQVIRLSETPELLSQVVKIIEKEFGYKAENSVEVDFYPLLKEDNFYNNFVLINDVNEVLGHVGTKPCVYSIGENQYPILHMGGIAVPAEHQGKGYFRKLFSEVVYQLEKRHAFLFLWSDKQDLYEKFGFFPVGGQIQPKESYKDIEGYQKTTYKELNENEKQNIQDIYKANSLFFFKPDRDWDDFANTTSANLYIKKDSQEIIGYYLEGKGQDLNNVIHEFGIHIDHFEEEFVSFQDNACFMPFQFFPIEQDFFQLQYTALCKFGNPYFLQNFIKDFSRGEIQNIQKKDDQLTFIFDNNDYQLTSREMLEALWGPQVVQEFFGRYQGLYIPGIESI